MKQLKIRLFIPVLLLTRFLFSQDLNYCDYYSIQFSLIVDEGHEYKSCEPIIFAEQTDRAGDFFRKHRNRFDYILYKHINDYKELGDYFPDTNRIRQAFCDQVLHSPKIQHYFAHLTPAFITAQKPEKDTFKLDELMLVASRFFYCDYINKADTSIQSHMCIAINGQKDIHASRDYTVLEAFNCEAIFYYFGKKKDPLFLRQFTTFTRKTSQEKRFEFADFESYLLLIRNLSYDYMQHNDDLKKKLLNYYHKNRLNLNFELIP